MRMRNVVLLVVALTAWSVTPIAGQATDEVALPVVEAFDEGRLLFENLEPSAAIERFTEVIETLQPVVEGGTSSEAQRRYLLNGLAFRARAAFSIGRAELVGEDLELAIRLDPGFACEDALVSPVLIQQCGEVQGQMVGRLDLRVTPADAEVEVDGVVVDPTASPVAVLAGPHFVSVNRAGYEGLSESVDVAAGEGATRFDVDLSRVSAVLRIVTRPAGATVHVDTVPHGPTSGSAELDESRDAVIEGFPRREFSAELTVPNLPTGSASVVVTLDGYRTVQTELDLSEAADYPVHFVLERAEGTVVFEGVPAGATVAVEPRLAGERRVIDVGAGPVTLPIGVYDVAVAHPSAGYFDSTATVVDRQEYRVPVRLRPRAVLVGILGEDDVGRGFLNRALTRAFDALDGWTLQSRHIDGGPMLDRVGLTAAVLRDEVNPLVPRTSPLDWERVRSVVEQAMTGSVFLVGVLDNDLSAQHADVWMWRSDLQPSRPTRLRVSLAETRTAAAVETLTRGFADVAVARPWLGALLVDTDAEAGVFVTSITTGGPAHVAGLLVGDVVVGVDGVRVSRVADLTTRLAGVPWSQEVPIVYRRAGVLQESALTRVLGPATVGLGDRTVAYPAAAARLLAMADGNDAGQPGWVWDLNDAAVALELGDVETALDTLRQLEQVVPSGTGVGRGVVQYWLGLAYLEAGPTFSEQARRAFEAAAGDPNGRLWHTDGPWVAPRARARLAQIDSGVGAR